MNKPAIPVTPVLPMPALVNQLERIKQNIELMQGVQGGRIVSLSQAATLTEVVAKLNEVIARLNF